MVTLNPILIVVEGRKPRCWVVTCPVEGHTGGPEFCLRAPVSVSLPMAPRCQVSTGGLRNVVYVTLPHWKFQLHLAAR